MSKGAINKKIRSQPKKGGTQEKRVVKIRRDEPKKEIETKF
jgi:hypothetical protein